MELERYFKIIIIIIIIIIVVVVAAAVFVVESETFSLKTGLKRPSYFPPSIGTRS